jgi:glutamyl-tRNA synthetase
VPLIFGPDKRKLSKRHGAVSVMEYARAGYLPEAMVNFLALLGWSPATGQEVFRRDELIAAFGLEGISGGNPVFNPEKLDWMNQQHLWSLPPHELAARLRPWFEAKGLWDPSYVGDRHAWFFAVIELLKPRVKTLNEFTTIGRFFFTDEVEYDEAAVRAHLGHADMGAHLRDVDVAFARLDAFDAASAEAALRATAAARGLKAPTLFHAVRVAITGRAASPGLFDVLALVGRERTHRRLMTASALVAPRA